MQFIQRRGRYEVSKSYAQRNPCQFFTFYIINPLIIPVFTQAFLRVTPTMVALYTARLLTNRTTRILTTVVAQKQRKPARNLIIKELILNKSLAALPVRVAERAVKGALQSILNPIFSKFTRGQANEALHKNLIFNVCSADDGSTISTLGAKVQMFMADNGGKVVVYIVFFIISLS